MQGLIILGHGSKAPEALATLVSITAMVREKVRFQRVEHASLQMSRPGLEEVASEMAENGFSRILIVPFFIASGQHVKEDIPGAIGGLRQRYPGVEFSLGRPLGDDPRLADILLERVAELESSAGAL